MSPTKTHWQSVLLVCGKCSRKLDGGFGHKQREALRDELRSALDDAGHRRDVEVIETKCLGECPKDAVAVVNGSAPGTLYAVPAGMPAQDVLAQVMKSKG
ncbi:(2Fe-2S) ferredoxin domain-containing protein [Rhodovastum atsumiense]|uniref:(2Fe-2S) ferredoxin domain-containing protein n=1 Tax=Rhodovastum atsumiense TaxID=504468 RepID=A0A5M6IJT8_9PROT|nr:(2Fe-2S) ferredoxin domain-containing protein [Rhodovastum atsumiense]KAA5608157.1 (2Fe-2S) ferredoxin domain-containing protein [Rhodovastum atsumiense]